MHLYIDKCIPWRESERNAWAVFTTLPQEQTQPIFRGFISISGWRVVLCTELVCHSWRESPCITYTAHNNILMQPWCSCLPQCVGKMQWYTMNGFWMSVYQSQTHLTMLQRKLWLTLMTHHFMFEDFVSFFLFNPPKWQNGQCFDSSHLHEEEDSF